MLHVVCALLMAATPAADTTRLKIERQVQAVVIDSLFVRDTTRQVAIDDSTITGGSHFVDEDYQAALRMLGALPSGLRKDFESVRPQRLPVGPLTLKRPVTLVTSAARQNLHTARSADAYWSAFYRRFPGTPGYLKLSRVGFSRDGRSALVLVEHECGGLCGGTLYVMLQREGAKWHIARKAQPRMA